jgi:hypothetical protein
MHVKAIVNCLYGEYEAKAGEHPGELPVWSARAIWR